ncbi:hypothetical protein [Bacillus pumilus]|uniref:hypothetical protein n=1 Tax=Bacillus pumilus TaxID=1408 RepID=UPI0011A7B44E|nr:hypothetical protein [Bacillus pumilus]
MRTRMRIRIRIRIRMQTPGRLLLRPDPEQGLPRQMIKRAARSPPMPRQMGPNRQMSKLAAL